MSRTTLAVTPSVRTVMWDEAAFASQGPGDGIGTASHPIQPAMAVLVYGTSAIIVGAGLIGAARGALASRAASSSSCAA